MFSSLARPSTTRAGRRPTGNIGPAKGANARLKSSQVEKEEKIKKRLYRLAPQLRAFRRRPEGRKRA